MKARSNYRDAARRTWPLLNLAAIVISLPLGCGRQEPLPLPDGVSQEVRLSTDTGAPGDCLFVLSVLRNESPRSVDVVLAQCDGIPRIDGALQQGYWPGMCSAGPDRLLTLAPGAEHRERGLAGVRTIDPGEHAVRVWHLFAPSSSYPDALRMVATDVTFTVTRPGTQEPVACALAQTE